MPRTAPKKCITCSQLSMIEVIELHGEKGDNCWSPKVCRSRRHYYRNRQEYNQRRWQQHHPEKSRQETQEQESVLDVSLPEYPVAIIQMYRAGASADVHAVGAELWIGGKLASLVEPVHCLGLTEGQVKLHLRRILQAFSEHHGITLTAFGSQVSIDPIACPLRPCPLKPFV